MSNTNRFSRTLFFSLLVGLMAPQLVACDTGTAEASSYSPGASTDSRPLGEHAPASIDTEADPATADDIDDLPAPAAVLDEPPTPDIADAAEHAGEPSDWVDSGAVDGLSVRRFVVAHGVDAREPTGVATPFTAGVDRVYAFIDARNVSSDDREMRVLFERPDGRRVGHVALDVPAERGRWRTWGYTRHVTVAGTWHALVVADDGTELARRAFEVR